MAKPFNYAEGAAWPGWASGVWQTLLGVRLLLARLADRGRTALPPGLRGTAGH